MHVDRRERPEGEVDRHANQHEPDASEADVPAAHSQALRLPAGRWDVGHNPCWQTIGPSKELCIFERRSDGFARIRRPWSRTTSCYDVCLLWPGKLLGGL